MASTELTLAMWGENSAYRGIQQIEKGGSLSICLYSIDKITKRQWGMTNFEDISDNFPSFNEYSGYSVHNMVDDQRVERELAHSRRTTTAYR